ncbi:hypothetical protein EC532_00680 [Helicobacter pylori]|uniref:hypothetical protein n=1 Tax=Helicobacter pylori TaxID=210 RepID=UPI000FDCE0D6|nr:hypothetical protein [Helicobacter pylori]RVZ15546.1 hypothetical protein EC532_00680 [Helicobacter pylori]
MIGAIKTLRELEIIAILFNHYRDGYSVSNLNGNILLQTSLKRKSHNKKNGGVAYRIPQKRAFLNNKRNN